MEPELALSDDGAFLAVPYTGDLFYLNLPLLISDAPPSCVPTDPIPDVRYFSLGEPVSPDEFPLVRERVEER